jgi:hypothetical protein
MSTRCDRHGKRPTGSHCDICGQRMVYYDDPNSNGGFMPTYATPNQQYVSPQVGYQVVPNMYPRQVVYQVVPNVYPQNMYPRFGYF